MSSLQEFFNQPENGKAKGIVQKNNILKRNIIARMAIEGECTQIGRASCRERV